jgi:hypothetical protein
VYPDPQRLEDISSIRDAMRQISQEAQAVVELLDVRMEDRMYAASLSLYSLYLLKQARNWTLIRIGIQGRRTVMRCRELYGVLRYPAAVMQRPRPGQSP